MSPPVLEVGGFAVRAPVTVLTNVILAGQALWLTRRFERAGRSCWLHRGWPGFMQIFAAAALAGALKHATGPGPLHEAVRILANLLVGTAISWVALTGGVRPRPIGSRRRLVVGAAFLGFATATVAWPDFHVVVAFVAAMVAWIVVDAAKSRKTARGRDRYPLAAIAVAGLAGLAWLSPLEIGRWIRGIDVAHIALMVTLALLARVRPHAEIPS